MRVWLWAVSGGEEVVVNDDGLLGFLEACEGEPLDGVRVVPFDVSIQGVSE